MKTQLLIAASMVLLLACSKENQPETHTAVEDGKKFPVAVSMRDFLTKVENLPSPFGRHASSGISTLRDSALVSSVTNLYFELRGDLDFPVRRWMQDTADADFGSYTDSLPAGVYTLSVAGSSSPMEYLTGILRSELTTDGVGMPIGMKPVPDIFRESIQFTLANDTVNYFEVQMKRQTCLLEVNILDAQMEHPDSAVTVSISPCVAGIIIGHGGDSDVIYAPVSLTKRSSTTFSDMILRNFESPRIVISYPDRNSNARLTKTIPFTHFQPNQKIILTGQLYRAVNMHESEFAIRVNDIYDQTQVIEF